MLKVMILVLCFMPITVYGYGIDDMIQYHTSDLWYTGNDLINGDSFTYHICDYVTFVGYDVCYMIQLDFYQKLQSHNSDVWIVQGVITQNHTTHHAIFLIDEDMNITTDLANLQYARSLENTLFYLNQFASFMAPQNLRVGSIWGEASSILSSDLVVTSTDYTIIYDLQIDTFVLEYKLFESSVFLISFDFPFPVNALVYNPYWTSPDPPVSFALDLVEYSHHNYTK